MRSGDQSCVSNVRLGRADLLKAAFTPPELLGQLIAAALLAVETGFFSVDALGFAQWA